MRWCSTTTWGSAPWQRCLVAVLAALSFWPKASVEPAIGLDTSWPAGLALARVDHLAWGPDVMFPYGPLGFLQNTAYYSFEQSLLATIYQPLVVGALLLGIAAALRQRHAPMTSLLGALATTGIVGVFCGHDAAPGLLYPEVAVVAAFAWAAVRLLQHDPKHATVLITCVSLGGVAGFQLLVKISTGLAIAVIALTLSLLLDWRALARHCVTLAAFAASTMLFWVLAGQRPTTLPTWLRYGASVVSGYSQGAALPLNFYTQCGVVWTLSWLAVLGVTAVRGGPQIPRRLVVLAALAAVICARLAIGRSDTEHLFVLVGLVVAAIAIIPFSKIPRRAAVLIVALFVVMGTNLPPVRDHLRDAVIDPTPSALAVPHHRRIGETSLRDCVSTRCVWHPDRPEKPPARNTISIPEAPGTDCRHRAARSVWNHVHYNFAHSRRALHPQDHP